MTDIADEVRHPWGPFCTRSTRYDGPLLSLGMTNIEGRFRRLRKRVVPHDEWVSDNPLTDIARDLTEEND